MDGIDLGHGGVILYGCKRNPILSGLGVTDLSFHDSATDIDLASTCLSEKHQCFPVEAKSGKIVCVARLFHGIPGYWLVGSVYSIDRDWMHKRGPFSCR